MKTGLILTCAAMTAAAQPPNVLFVAFDDLRPDLGCYGENHMVTPHMDSLAAQGRMFRNHYVAVPTCGASRYALLSGRRPTSATDDNNAFNAMPATLPAQPESWVDLLRRHGELTVIEFEVGVLCDGRAEPELAEPELGTPVGFFTWGTASASRALQAALLLAGDAQWLRHVAQHNGALDSDLESAHT